MHIAPSHSIRRNIANPFFPHLRVCRGRKIRDEVSKSTLGEGDYVMESYYDDYTPDVVMGNITIAILRRGDSLPATRTMDMTSLQNNSNNNKCNRITMRPVMAGVRNMFPRRWKGVSLIVPLDAASQKEGYRGWVVTSEDPANFPIDSRFGVPIEQ